VFPSSVAAQSAKRTLKALCTVTSVAVSVLLLLASLAKLESFTRTGSTDHLLFESRLATTGEIAIEVVLGLWLLSGLNAARAMFATSLVFCCFSVFLIVQVVSGKDHCHCFGQELVVPIAAMLFLDIGLTVVAFFAGLHLWKTPESKSFCAQYYVLISSCFIVVCMVALSIFQTTPTKFHSDGSTVGTTDWISIEPTRWVGRRLAWLEHLNCAQDLVEGEWTIILVNQNCSKCHELIGKLRRSQRSSNIRVAWISTGDQESGYFPNDHQFCKFTAEIHVYYESPVLINIIGGWVLEVEDDPTKILNWGENGAWSEWH